MRAQIKRSIVDGRARESEQGGVRICGKAKISERDVCVYVCIYVPGHPLHTEKYQSSSIDRARTTKLAYVCLVGTCVRGYQLR